MTELQKTLREIQINLSRMKVSIMANNLTILFCIIAFPVAFDTKAYFMENIQKFFFAVANIHSEDSLLIVILFSLAILSYYFVYAISNYFVKRAILKYNEITKNAEIKLWRYKLMTYLPFINIFVIYSINKKINVAMAKIHSSIS